MQLEAKFDTTPLVEEKIKPEPESLSETSKNSEVIIKADPNKCFSCTKKTGLLGYQCKCSHNYCKNHRLPEDHDCSYDFRSEGRERLAEANPLVRAEKVQKI